LQLSTPTNRNELQPKCMTPPCYKSYFPKWLVLLLPFCLSSCFELKEELLITKAGSGSYKLVIDCSEHKDMLSELIAKSDSLKQNPFGEKGNSLESLASVWQTGVADFANLKGVRNAKEITDKQNFIFGFSFDFDDIGALNLALVMKDGGDYNADFKLPYSYEKGKLTKNNVFVFKKLFKNLIAADKNEPEYIQSQKKAIFAQIRYKCIIRTLNKIKKSSNNSYELSADKKQVSLSAFLSEVYGGISQSDTNIKFK
jgi:hypothetical protein